MREAGAREGRRRVLPENNSKESSPKTKHGSNGAKGRASGCRINQRSKKKDRKKKDVDKMAEARKHKKTGAKGEIPSRKAAESTERKADRDQRKNGAPGVQSMGVKI